MFEFPEKKEGKVRQICRQINIILIFSWLWKPSLHSSAQLQTFHASLFPSAGRMTLNYAFALGRGKFDFHARSQTSHPVQMQMNRRGRPP